MGPAIVLALLLAVSPPAAHAAPAQPPAHALAGTDSLASDVDSGDPEIRNLLTLINHQRHVSGCPPLVWDPAIAREARRYSRDMAERGFFDHVSPAGANLLDRLRSAGIKFRGAAENLSAGQNTGDQVFANWMNDWSERRILLNSQFTRVGVGRSGAIWTLMLVRPR